MPYRTTPFYNDGIYHIYNRGVDRQNIFLINRDRQRFLKTLGYYQIENPKPKFSTYQVAKTFPVNETKRIVEIVAYCLMPNHFHLLVQQTKDGGITEFTRKFIHSYTKYFNVKHRHEGPIFNGMFKSVPIESDEQFLHVSRYIHLNPLVSKLVPNLGIYPWSSYDSYINNRPSPFPLLKEKLLEMFKSPKEYEKFVLDQAAYGETLEMIKHEALDIDMPH